MCSRGIVKSPQRLLRLKSAVAGCLGADVCSRKPCSSRALVRLKVIRAMEFDPRVAQLVMCGAYLADHRLGSAGQWMIEHLSAVVGS